MFGSIDGMEQLYKLVGNTFLQYRERKREREREREFFIDLNKKGLGLRLRYGYTISYYNEVHAPLRIFRIEFIESTV
jgi:hypothetical protein